MTKRTVLFLDKTDLDLKGLALPQDFDGRMARKEIQRRKLVGYCDGTAIEYVDPRAEMEEENSRVGLITINGVAQ